MFFCLGNTVVIVLGMFWVCPIYDPKCKPEEETIFGILYFSEISQGNWCLDTLGYRLGTSLGMHECHGKKQNQVLIFLYFTTLKDLKDFVYLSFLYFTNEATNYYLRDPLKKESPHRRYFWNLHLACLLMSLFL